MSGISQEREVERAVSEPHRTTHADAGRFMLVVAPDAGFQATLCVLFENQISVYGAPSLGGAMDLLSTGAAPTLALVEQRLVIDRQTGAIDTEFLQAFHTHAPGCLIILLSDEEDRSDPAFRPTGIGAVIPKLCAMDYLIHRVDDLLRLRGEKPLWSRRMSCHVGRALSYIAHCYNQAPRLDAISSVACLSPSRLCALFRQQLDRSPKELLVRIRLEVAKRTLCCSNEKLDTIAESLGFCDASHFSRVFKRYVGAWPGDYRRAQPYVRRVPQERSSSALRSEGPFPTSGPGRAAGQHHHVDRGMLDY